jgi:two-component system cell cycle sensor histidine kinase/response regulator CckA
LIGQGGARRGEAASVRGARNRSPFVAFGREQAVFSALVAAVTAAVVLVPFAVYAESAEASAGISPRFWMIVTALVGLAGTAALVWAAARQRSTLLLGRILEALPVPRLIVDSKGRVIAATDAWRALLGDAELSVARLGEIAGQQGMADRFERLTKAIARGEAASVDIRVNLPGMEYARISVHPVSRFANHVIWNINDTSDRYALERIIRSEQEKLIEFVEDAPIGFFSVDQDGRFLYANATFADWLGRAEHDLVGTGVRLSEFLPPALRTRCAAYSLLADEQGDAFGETRLVGRDGPFDAYVTQTVVTDESGRSLHTRSLVRHLTAERRIEEDIEVSRERFRRFFEEAPVGIVLLDGDGTITECNRAFAKTLGIDAADAVQRKFVDYVKEDDRERCRTWLAGAYEAGVPAAPVEAKVGSGSVSLYAARAGNGGMIVHVFDLSEQKRLEAQFFQSQKMELVGQLAGGVAHDFNNLLTAMIGFCDLLLLRHTPRDQSFADIQQIKQNANRAANLVRQLLAFSRQQTLQPKVLDLTEVLSETSHLLRRLIGASIELKFYHGRDLWLTKADQGQFEQVVINLAVNARDAMAGAGGGTLTIRTSNVYSGDPRLREYEGIPDGDYVLLEMQDTGTGIPPDVIDKIFEPFFTTKEVGAGTGLGLSTVYGIVKQTGGYVFVDSGSGHGARFSVYLPRHREEEEPVPVAEKTEDELRHDLTGAGTVLLVEDEDAVRLFGARALRNKGYQVIEAKDGEDALEMLNGTVDGMATTQDGELIDLLITDVVMPGVDGPTLVREVRDRYPSLKVIFISGYTEDTFRQKLGEGEQVEFLSKPFTLQQLAGKVKEVMDGA